MSIDKETQAQIDAYAINELRAERDRLLTQTDWVVIKEREEGGSVSNFADWKEYRQKLRDLPKQYSDDKKTEKGYLDWSKITVPTKPSE